MTAPSSLRDTRVKRFSPAGSSDSLDATDEFPGACTALTNLVPDLSTRNLWTCRPAATAKIDFSTWTSPIGTNIGINSVISVCKVIGNIVYGMCNTSFAQDAPFAYDLVANAFLTVTIASTVYPSSQTPTLQQPVATMDIIGHTIVITHPGYLLNSTGCKGTLDISSPSAPVYYTGDLTGAITFVALGAIPSWVVQFNQRAYYGVNAAQPSMPASDVLNPNNITNAGQSLTFGDTLPLVTAYPLGLSNQLGGIIQSLMVFKGVTNIYQVTGDFTGGWSINSLNVATGTNNPRSVCSTPLGLAFIAPDGLRIIDQNGTVSDPIGIGGRGINVPLTIVNTPVNDTLVFVTGCDSTTIRVSCYSVQGVALQAEFWYNIPRKVWSGPHTPFIASQYVLWQGTFLGVSWFSLVGFSGSLYLTNTNPSTLSTFSELGSPLQFTQLSAMLEDSGSMAQSELSEMQLVSGSGASKTLTVTIQDSNGTTINTANPLVVNASGSTPGLYPYRVDFPAISVFNRMAVKVTGASSAGLKLGDIWMRVKTLGYAISGQAPST